MSKGLSALLAVLVVVPASLAQQSAPSAAPDRAAAYYHFSMGHIYAEAASTYGNRAEYADKAIDHYKKAMKADPEASFLAEEVADLYIQSGRISEAVREAQAAVKEDPNDLNSRRILGRIALRQVGDTRTGKVNERMLKEAIEQYSKIVEREPSDIESWMTLGRLHKAGQNSVESEKAFRKALELDPESEDALTGLAMVYTDLGDARRASEMLQKVAEKSPNLRTLTQLAGAYEQMRDYALAAETLRRAAKLAEDNIELKKLLARNEMLAEQWEQALKTFGEVVAAEPNDAESHLRMSQIYRQLRKFDKAREENDAAKKLAPESLEVLYNEVGILEAEGKMPDAVQTLKHVINQTAKRSYTAAERQNRTSLLERLGELYRANDQHAEALAAFREMGELDVAVASRAAAQVIDTHRQSKDLVKALEEADAAHKKWPEDRTIHIVRASVLADSGRSDEAASEVRKLLDGKNDRATYLTIAQMYEKGKNYPAMGKALDEAEKLSSTNDEKETVYFMRGAMFERMKKPEQSEAEFRKVLAINPASASALNYLGYMLADRDVRLSEALEMIRKAVEQEPHNGAYLDSLGWVYFRLGKLDEAENYLKQAIEKTGTDPTVNDHLGDVYAKQGNLKDAITQWEKATRLWEAGSPAERDAAEVAKITKKVEGAKVRLAREQQKRK